MDYRALNNFLPSVTKAFLNPMGKFEFQKGPFRLAQTPTSFQQLFSEVLSGPDLNFQYLDDIFI